MRWWRGILATCAATVVATTAATAQQLIGVGVFGSGSPVTVRTTIPVRITGVLSVTFHGDPAAGCARWGLCGYSGTVSWQPPPRASIEIDRTAGPHPRLAVNLFPDFSAGPQAPGGVTSASVALTSASSAPASHCLDANQAGGVVSVRVRRGHMTFSLAHGSPPLLSTRCAGPRDADVLPHLPAPTLPLTALKHGQTSISLAASRPLAAHGFAGSITSTLVIHVGRPGKPRPQRSGSPHGHARAGRQVVVTYRAKLRGTIVEEIRGAANPLVCGALGSCGLTGTITITPPTSATTGRLTVEALATTPRRKLLAAAGLGPGSPGHVRGFGVLGWDATGTVAADLRQGSEHCVDSAPGGALELIFVTGGGRWRLSTLPGGVLGVPPAPGIHCPGPALASEATGSAAVPLSSLDQRTARVALTTGSTVHDDGYRVRIVPHLRLTLTRVKIRMRAIRIPPGELLGAP